MNLAQEKRLVRNEKARRRCALKPGATTWILRRNGRAIAHLPEDVVRVILNYMNYRYEYGTCVPKRCGVCVSMCWQRHPIVRMLDPYPGSYSLLVNSESMGWFGKMRYVQLHINGLINMCFHDLYAREADHIRVTDNVPRGNFDWTMVQFVKGLQERGVCSSKWCLFNKENIYGYNRAICYIHDSHFPTINGLTETVVHCWQYTHGLDNIRHEPVALLANEIRLDLEEIIQYELEEVIQFVQ